jgi:hypothetical protein
MAIEQLEDRVAVVTGAASGLDVEAAPLTSLVDRLVASGATAVGVPIDVTDADAVDALARAAVDASEPRTSCVTTRVSAGTTTRPGKHPRHQRGRASPTWDFRRPLQDSRLGQSLPTVVAAQSSTGAPTRSIGAASTADGVDDAIVGQPRPT